MVLHIPFSDIIKRDENVYDYAELPRLITLSQYNKELERYVIFIRDIMISIELSNEFLIIKQLAGGEIKIPLENTKLADYINNVTCHIKDTACLRISDRVHTHTIMLSVSKSSLIFYTAEEAKQIRFICLHGNNISISKEQLRTMTCPPATWIRGLLRYALSKVIVVYILKRLLDSSPKRIFNYLMCLGRMIMHDDRAVIFCISKPLIWLPSLIFGAGGLKGILEVRESGVALNGACSYELNLNASNIMSLNIFAKLINDICGDVIPVNNTLDVFKCLVSIFSIVSAAMGVSIPYLKGPLVPPTARYRDIKGHPTPQVMLEVPDIPISVNEIVQKGDLLLERYSEYLVRRVGPV